MRLSGKTALVTGAARGIGAAAARALAAEGARVLLTDIRDDQGRETARQIGGMAEYRRLDVREEADWIAAVDDALARWGGLDVLVNNAGVTGFEDAFVPHDPEHASLEDWHAVHRTNLDGVFLGCKHAIPHLRAAGRSWIINIGSLAGKNAFTGGAAYCASKAGLNQFSEALMQEVRHDGIRVSYIMPGSVATDFDYSFRGTSERDGGQDAQQHEDRRLAQGHERVVGQDADAVASAKGNIFPLNFPRQQVIARLVGVEEGGLQRPLHLRQPPPGAPGTQQFAGAARPRRKPFTRQVHRVNPPRRGWQSRTTGRCRWR